jgi:hypothetical protein
MRNADEAHIANILEMIMIRDLSKIKKAEPLMTLPSLMFRNVALNFPATRHTVVVLIESFALSFLPSPAC